MSYLVIWENVKLWHFTLYIYWNINFHSSGNAKAWYSLFSPLWTLQLQTHRLTQLTLKHLLNPNNAVPKKANQPTLFSQEKHENVIQALFIDHCQWWIERSYDPRNLKVSVIPSTSRNECSSLTSSYFVHTCPNHPREGASRILCDLGSFAD